MKRRDAVETVVEMRQDLTRHLLAQVRYLVALIRACAVASRLTICTWLDRSATFGLSRRTQRPLLRSGGTRTPLLTSVSRCRVLFAEAG